MSDAREQYDFIVPSDLNAERIDVALVSLIGAESISRSRIQAIIKEGFLMLDGEVCRLPKFKVATGNHIIIDAPVQEMTSKAEPENIPLDVMYEDDSVLVINKAAGMVVHPGAGNWSGTIVNAVLGRDSEMADDEAFDPLRPGIVHRLDKDTSGCLVIAKTPKALRKLSKAFADREVEKTYLAIVHNWPIPESSLIHTNIARHPSERKRMIVRSLESGDGRDALTFYKVEKKGFLEGTQKLALLSVRLYTGRTHQIRVHMAHIKHPLAGELTYGFGRIPVAPRQMLHAWRLAFPHPESGETMNFEAPIPDDLREMIRKIEPVGK